MTLKAIEQAALKLPAKARGKLAAALLATLDDADQSDIDQAWAKESDRRYRAYKAGKTGSVSAKEAITAARMALRK